MRFRMATRQVSAAELRFFNAEMKLRKGTRQRRIRIPDRKEQAQVELEWEWFRALYQKFNCWTNRISLPSFDTIQ